MREPIFTSILQIGIVVDNLEIFMQKYYEEYGIGPWEVHLYTEENLKEMKVNGEGKKYSMKAAFCQHFNVQLELIEPLDDNNIYAEFLEKHGPGLHHIAFDTQNQDGTIQAFKEKGVNLLQEGVYFGKGFTYLDTLKDLGFISEIYKSPVKWVKPDPIAIYPPKTHQS